MKVKVISRDEASYTRERTDDLQKVQRNADPDLHPFARAREYTRALNSAKLDKVFAKPFIASLDGHHDGVYTLRRHPKFLTTFVSGSGDGEIRVWDAALKKCRLAIPEAHEGIVRGIAVAARGDRFLSCASDKLVRLWDYNPDDGDVMGKKPLTEYTTSYPFHSIDHHISKQTFITCGGTEVAVWDYIRSLPVQTYDWSAETVLNVRYNPVEDQLFASSGTDRSITLYDMRSSQPLHKIVMAMRTNGLCWNPMEAFNFVTANEDHNLYSYDMRKMGKALCVHKDHVSAVMNVQFSPTGREFVSGSYDRTIRIFGDRAGQSREVYHTRRMQRVFAVEFTGDARFVVSGSDDTNVRIWKAEASKPLRVVSAREQQSLSYADKLKERFEVAPEVKRIVKHKHLPKPIFKAKKLKATIEEAERKKTIRRKKHGDKVKRQHERKKGVIAEVD
mmetsp:Transcript_5505/g.12600  ORF Transcript_5505/g.12600 Transcript_5505/m.12600 type:complete len:447 (-) Transcript_5505:1888-3228(-)